ncbi:f-box and wd repeat domain-containing [Anaeramoeba flamelloides]|uniref:F-box and wd repeat domain-containing n=1 Tax=Anaeramoeba flamelloides TaxID=1746091 RepID=A0AAV7ZY17_9EUKA|nr:f-box and wd repeat domain-containing [Anaeramoeba flamelloides]
MNFFGNKQTTGNKKIKFPVRKYLYGFNENQELNERLKFLGQIDPDVVCKISNKIMTNPVLAEDGQTYDQSCFDKIQTSPFNGQQIGANVSPNSFARIMVNKYLGEKRKSILLPIKKLFEEKNYFYVLKTIALYEKFSIEKDISLFQVKITVMETLLNQGIKGSYKFQLVEHYLQENRILKAIQVYECMLIYKQKQQQQQQKQKQRQRQKQQNNKTGLINYPISVQDEIKQEKEIGVLQKEEEEEEEVAEIGLNNNVLDLKKLKRIELNLNNLEILLKILPLIQEASIYEDPRSKKQTFRSVIILIVKIYLNYDEIQQSIKYINKYKESESIEILKLWIEILTKKNNKGKEIARISNKLSKIYSGQGKYKKAISYVELAMNSISNIETKSQEEALEYEHEKERYSLNMIECLKKDNQKQRAVTMLMALGKKYEKKDLNKSDYYYTQAYTLDEANEKIQQQRRVSQNEENFQEQVNLRFNNALQASLESNNPYLIIKEMGTIFSDLVHKIERQSNKISEQREMILNQKNTIAKQSQYLLNDHTNLKHFLTIDYQLPVTLHGHQEPIMKIFQMSGSKILSFSRDWQVIIWDWKSYKKETVIQLKPSTKRISPFKLNESQFLIIEKNVIKIYNLAGRCEKTLEGHQHEIKLALRLSNNKMITCDNDFYIIWDQKLDVEKRIKIYNLKDYIDVETSYGRSYIERYKPKIRTKYITESMNGEILYDTDVGTFVFDSKCERFLNYYSTHDKRHANGKSIRYTRKGRHLNEYLIRGICTEDYWYLDNIKDSYSKCRDYCFYPNLYAKIKETGNKNHDLNRWMKIDGIEQNSADEYLQIPNNFYLKLTNGTENLPGQLQLLDNNLLVMKTIRCFHQSPFLIYQLKNYQIAVASTTGDLQIYDFQNDIKNIIRKKDQEKKCLEKTVSALMKNKYFGIKDYQKTFQNSFDLKNVYLPSNIETILKSPCPFSRNENKIYHTHFLFLIHKDLTVNGLIDIINSMDYEPNFRIESQVKKIPMELDNNRKYHKWVLLYSQAKYLGLQIKDDLFTKIHSYINKPYKLTPLFEIYCAEFFFYLKYGLKNIFIEKNLQYFDNGRTRYTYVIYGNEIIILQGVRKIVKHKLKLNYFQSRQLHI